MGFHSLERALIARPPIGDFRRHGLQLRRTGCIQRGEAILSRWEGRAADEGGHYVAAAFTAPSSAGRREVVQACRVRMGELAGRQAALPL